MRKWEWSLIEFSTYYCLHFIDIRLVGNKKIYDFRSGVGAPHL
jgi:hypothetical protein